MYCSLFGLMRESDRTWFPPNHIFKLHQPASESLHFRIRWINVSSFPSFFYFKTFGVLCDVWPLTESPFLCRYYFPGWHNSSSSFAHRYGMSKGMESPVMDDCVMAYLFFQVRFMTPHTVLALIFLNVFFQYRVLCILTFVSLYFVFVLL